MSANRVGYVIDHIRASAPCTLQGVVNWCLEQGLEDVCATAITGLLVAGSIELSLDERDLIVDLL